MDDSGQQFYRGMQEAVSSAVHARMHWRFNGALV